jgi:cyd operon protein YbgT
LQYIDRSYVYDFINELTIQDTRSDGQMWYFTWILGIGVALAFGIINVMWLEAEAGFAERDESIERDSDRER